MQLDMFGATASAPRPRLATIQPPARPALPELTPTPPTVPWARRLTEAGAIETLISVSLLWTKIVLETLSLGASGRWFLYHDGRIVDAPADPASRARIVYMDIEGARALHIRHPLTPVTIGTTSALYRFAALGQAPAILPPPLGAE